MQKKEKSAPDAEQPAAAKGAGAGEKVRGLIVHVTTDLVETAVPKNSGHCMVSDAVKTAAAAKNWRISKVLTDLQTIRFTDLKKHIRYICFTPRVAQVALLQFDQGIKPESFSFRLSPVQIIRRAVKGQRRPKKRLALKEKSAGGGGGYARPIIHGGDALPTTVGLRREFGLRQLGVWKPPTEAATATAGATA